MKIVTLAGEKGGIGKTTLCFHLAHYLAEIGRRVLALDLDPQANLTYTFLGESAAGVKRVLLQERPLLEEVLPAGYDGRLAILGSNKTTGDVRNYLAASGSHLDALAGLLAQAEDFDFVLADTPPSPAMGPDGKRVLDALTAPALFASDYILAPVILEQLPLGGLAALSATIRALQEWGSRVQLMGVIPTMYDARTKEHTANLRELVDVYNALVYPVVGRAIAVSQCPSYGLPVWAFDKRNKVSGQLRAVAERMERDGKETTQAT